MRVGILALLTVAACGLRLSGVKTAAFQAFAHGLVAWLVADASRSEPSPDGEAKLPVNGIMAVVLTGVEIVAFLSKN
jgi:hypothetical protein